MMRRRNAINDSMKEEKKRPFWRYLLEALLVIALIIGINSWRTRDAVSGPAPMLSGNTLNGESYLLPRKPGEPLLVYFWASWCPVCKFQDGNIATLSEEFPVITVAMSSGADEEISDYLEQEGLELAVINDDTGEISNRWGVKGVPTTFVIDGEGEVRFVEVGYTTTPGLRLRRWLAEVF